MTRRLLYPGLTVLLILAYAGTFAVVRQTHTWYWFEKENDRRVNYTLFDSYSRIDDALYIAFYPACVMDHAITSRHFERDKF